MPDQHTLLIVDDCPEDREVYRDFLADDPFVSYQFLEAPLAEVGLDLFRQQPCDAILLDFYMPDMNGLEFFSKLKQYSTLKQPPIIMLTGQGNERIAVQAIKEGIQDYLIKQHLQPEVLQLAVRKVIQQSQLRSLLDRTREQQRIVATTALRIRQSLELGNILTTAVAEVKQLLECEHVAVYQCQEASCFSLGSVCSTQVRLEHPENLSPQVCVRAELGHRVGKPELEPCVDLSCQMLRIDQISRQPAVCDDLVAPICVVTSQAPMGQHWGYLVAHQQGKKVPWQVDEHAIVEELAVQIAIAIQQSALLSEAQSALKQSQELNQFKSQIVSTISHEYRTPLTTILAAASTLTKHTDTLSDDQKNRYLKLIQDKARHMGTLVDDMLLMHEYELNQAKFQPTPLDLLQFVADLVEEHQSAAGNQHELVFKISGHTRGFWGDRGMLRFAIGNVLSNAVKYTPQGGVVNIALHGHNDAIRLTIQDAGIGIPEIDQTNLFQSFHRASNVGTLPGIGLGLSIAKSCVEMHSGAIAIESKPGKGTIVVIELPKEPAAVENLCKPNQ